MLGNIKEEQGTIDAPIDAINTEKEDGCGRWRTGARTHFRVIYRFGNATLVSCRLETGRTHQIRVHMAWLRHPVLNDPVYGPKSTKHEKGQLLRCGPHCFMHPRTAKKALMFFMRL